MGITAQQVISSAKSLASEHGENSEYDRALVELTNQLLGRTSDRLGFTEREVLPRHTFVYEIEITTADENAAERVLRERLDHDEDLGFEYSIDSWSLMS